MEVCLVQQLSPKEMESVTRFQILDKAPSI